MVDDNGPEGESDMRRRAAWLLAMLAVVAVLIVIVMTSLIGTDKGRKRTVDSGPLDATITTPAAGPSTPPGSASRAATHSTPTSPPPDSSSRHGSVSCPTSKTCVLDGDVGNGIAAINDYRTHHGQPAVPGSVSGQAQTCALHNGNGCSGGWAESQVGKPDGVRAVKKILQFGHLLDPQMKSIEVGWAYDPGAKQYYFAIIRND